MPDANEITTDEVLTAARNLQNRLRDFTAKDVWYEICVLRNTGKYSKKSRESAMRFIAATLIKNGARSSPSPISKKRYHFDD